MFSTVTVLCSAGYTLSYKRESGEWQEVVIDPDRKTYTLDGVKCGSSYQLFLTAVNSVGNGKPSSVITASTKGGGMHNKIIEFSYVIFYVY
jgi:hypothetical protein